MQDIVISDCYLNGNVTKKKTQTSIKYSLFLAVSRPLS